MRFIFHTLRIVYMCVSKFGFFSRRKKKTISTRNELIFSTSDINFSSACELKHFKQHTSHLKLISKCDTFIAASTISLLNFRQRKTFFVFLFLFRAYEWCGIHQEKQTNSERNKKAFGMCKC